MINVDKCNEETVNKYCAQFEIPVDGKLATRVRKLQTHQRENTPKERLSVACTACGGRSDVNLPECPFCGTMDMAEGDHEKAADAQAAGEPGVIDTEGVTVPVVVDKPDKPSKMVKTTSAEIATAGDLKQLKEAEEQVQIAKLAGASAYYDLGKSLFTIFEKNLWKHRVGPDGRASYRGFNQYVETVHQISGKHAYNMMDAASAFGREDFALVGVARLSLLVRFESEDKRKELLDQAKAGKLTKAKLAEMAKLEPARASRGSKSTEKAAAASRAKSQEKTKAPPPAAEGELTVVSKGARVKVPLFARPTKKGDKAKRAVNLGQDPHGVEESLNGITIRYRVVKEAAGLTLIIERERAAAAE